MFSGCLHTEKFDATITQSCWERTCLIELSITKSFSHGFLLFFSGAQMMLTDDDLKNDTDNDDDLKNGIDNENDL